MSKRTLPHTIPPLASSLAQSEEKVQPSSRVSDPRATHGLCTTLQSHTNSTLDSPPDRSKTVREMSAFFWTTVNGIIHLETEKARLQTEVEGLQARLKEVEQSHADDMDDCDKLRKDAEERVEELEAEHKTMLAKKYSMEEELKHARLEAKKGEKLEMWLQECPGITDLAPRHVGTGNATHPQSSGLSDEAKKSLDMRICGSSTRFSSAELERGPNEKKRELDGQSQSLRLEDGTCESIAMLMGSTDV